MSGVSTQGEKRRGSLWNALGSGMFGLNSLVLLMLVSQTCGVETAGVFGIAFTTAQLLYLVGLFGANHFQMTDYEERYSFRAYTRLKWASTALALLFLGAAIPLMGFAADKAVLTVLLTLYMLMHSCAELYQSLMFQKGRLDLSGQSMFWRTLFSLLCFAAVIVPTQNVYVASAALTLSGVLGLWLMAARPSRPFRQKACMGQAEGFQPLLAACVPMFFSLFLMNLIISAPKYAIEHFWNNHVQGVFNMIFMPAQVINLVGSFIFKPVLKGISGVAERRDAAGLKRVMGRQALAVGGLTAFCLLCVWVAGPEVLGFLYRAELQAWRLALALVILGGGLLAYCQLLYYIIVILRRQALILRNYVVTAVATAILCLFLVGRYGVTGGALAFAIAHALLLILHLWTLKSAWKERRHA